MTRACLVFVLLAAELAIAGRDYMGKVPPPIEVGGWINQRDDAEPSLESLRGQVVLIEFWATECGPCVQLIPHMVELYGRYRKKGLTILALSREERGPLEKFAHEKAMPYLIGFRNGSDYGVTGTPDAYLVGANGTVVWQGNPAGLTNEVLEAELAKVRLLPDLPYTKGMTKAIKEVKKGKLGKALKMAEALVESKDETERQQSTEVIKYLRALAQDLQDVADGYVVDEDYYRASLFLNEIGKSFDGHELGETAASTVKGWKKDDAVKSYLQASNHLALAEELISEEQFPRAHAELGKAAELVPEGSKLGKRAQERMRYVENLTRGHN